MVKTASDQRLFFSYKKNKTKYVLKKGTLQAAFYILFSPLSECTLQICRQSNLLRHANINNTEYTWILLNYILALWQSSRLYLLHRVRLYIMIYKENKISRVVN